jgi:hypothetical protein
MPRKDAAASISDLPGMGIHSIDIIQPPGIAIPCMAGIDALQKIVNPTLVRNSNAETAMNAQSDVLSEATPA